MNAPAWTETPPRRVVTLRQPWAWAICWAGKRVENRDWSPRAELPLPIAIHAGSRPAGARYLEMLQDVHSIRKAGIDVPAGWWNDRFDPTAPQTDQVFAWGHIVAIADIVAVGDEPPEGFRDPEQTMWWSRANAWWLDHVHVLERPVLARGRQGLCTLGERERAAVGAQIAAL